MNKESLQQYKKFLSNLSQEDKKQRYLYLKDLNDGKIMGPPTGYASIDLPWLKHHDENSIEALVNYETKNETMYQTLYKYAINHLEDIAFSYLNNDITYKELLANIDLFANALYSNNIKENDVIAIVLPNTPEARYLIYACSKIGAIANPIMPTVSGNDLLKIIENNRPKYFFLLEGLLSKFQSILKSQQCLEINPLISSKGFLQLIYKLKNHKQDNYNLFLESGQNVQATTINKDSKDIALIEQTGGTTGLTTKSVAITNGNIYASNYQLSNGGFDFQEGDSILDILLPSISYGAAFEHLTLSNGIKNYMIPTLVKKDINRKITKFKPNHIMMGPIHFEYICKSPFRRNWSFIKNIVSGGDTMSASLENNSNEKLKINKVKVPVEQGYGESECFGACACNHNDFVKKGSVGIPHLLTNIAIFEINNTKEDYTTDDEVQIGNQGEICLSSPVIMAYYMNDELETSLVLKTHGDGSVWLHTGDIGYIDEDGYLFITDRIKDLIFRNGFKVSPQKINQMILKNFGNLIDVSTVIGVPDSKERNVPVFFYKLKPEYEKQSDEFKASLQTFYSQNLSEVEIPKESVFLEEFPRTSVGKIDKKSIKQNYIKNQTKKSYTLTKQK